MTGLNEVDVAADPLEQFGVWFEEALEAGGNGEPNAMTLATATPDGVPSARMVLLKGFDERGFVFFTNHQSPKGRELASNPRAALVFYWGRLRRQVRVRGSAVKLDQEEAEAYFATRPLGSRLSAWASPQSAVLSGREELDRRFEEAARRFGDGEVPMPPFWGGWRLRPDEMEFWQGRPNRLHDRLRYARAGGEWRLERLSP